MIRIYSHIPNEAVFTSFLESLKEVKGDLEDVTISRSIIDEIGKDDIIIFLFKSPNNLCMFNPQYFNYENRVPKGLALFYNETFGLGGDYKEKLRHVIHKEEVEGNIPQQVLLYEGISKMPNSIEVEVVKALKNSRLPLIYDPKEIDDYFMVLCYVDENDVFLYDDYLDISKEVIEKFDSKYLSAVIIFMDEEMSAMNISEELMDYIGDADSYMKSRSKILNYESKGLQVSYLDTFTSILENLKKGR